ncbi:MAG: ATP-dependent DNA helicase [Clostridium sp.]|uniref:ATP-dependent DNA helicase n=1 Tax=Clostridium sp. TaxID=1506 RepID=UPI003D6C79B4
MNFTDYILDINKPIDIIEQLDFDEGITQKVWDLFDKKLPMLGYELREGQEDMAYDISEAIRDNRHIIIEAGVGIGKSYAYLAPLIYYNRLTNSPVIISTSTILLQEQLIKDIDKLSSIISIYPEVILAKGMSHFICLDRAFDYLNYNTKISKIYPWLEGWLVNTNNGDRTTLPNQIKDSLWKKLNVTACRSRECKYGFDCYYSKKRRSMLETKGIILCNHDLLAVDLQKKNKGLNPLLSKEAKLIVLDEAHNLEDKVRNSLKQEYLLNDVSKIVNEATQFLARLYSYDNMEDKILDLLKEIYIQLWEQVEVQYSKMFSSDGDIVRFYINKEKISGNVRLFTKATDGLSAKVQLANNVRFESVQDNIIENLEVIRDFFNDLVYKGSNMLFWIELSGKRNSFKDISIIGCQKKMHKAINELFFQSKKYKTILTSATLTNSFKGSNKERYSYIIKNLGFPLEPIGELSEPKKSPYPYNENALIYYKEDMPHPTNEREKFICKSIDVIAELLFITNGKSLMLFTSKSDMLAVYNGLLKKNLPWKLLVQQEGSSQGATIAEFKSDINSILLGTGVYWEGISIEGVALSNLIIFRLPFPVPDPVIDYKKSLSNNSLMEVDVPEMLVKLRQGVGRLIRNYEDKGIVTILDPRVGDTSNRPYKNSVWDALPIKTKTNDISKVKEFAMKYLNGGGGKLYK